MEEHWRSGYENAMRTLADPEVMQLPNRLEGVRTFDIGRDEERGSAAGPIAPKEASR